MSETKSDGYTSGPWHIDRGDVLESSDDPETMRWSVMKQVGDRAYFVATVENLAPGDTLETEKHTARLMSAAPELLAACRAAENCICELPPTLARVETLHAIQEAIAKAVGEND